MYQYTSFRKQTFKWFNCNFICVSHVLLMECTLSEMYIEKKMCLIVIFLWPHLHFLPKSLYLEDFNLTQSLFIAVKSNNRFIFYEWKSGVWCMSDCPSEYVIFCLCPLVCVCVLVIVPMYIHTNGFQTNLKKTANM